MLILFQLLLFLILLFSFAAIGPEATDGRPPQYFIIALASLATLFATFALV